MLVINKGANNYLRVTVTEKQTLTNPYYLLVFTSDVSGSSVYCLQTNSSTHTERYDEFLITERSTSLNTSSGIIELNPTGQWTYKIYEQTSSSNLNPQLATTLLETGVLKVVGTSETWTPYTGQDTTYIVHERQ